jgi:hypothetical protein
MHIALHFDADHESINADYDGGVLEAFFRVLLSYKVAEVSTQIYAGHLRLISLASDTEAIATGTLSTFYETKYLNAFSEWSGSMNSGWARFQLDKISSCYHRNTYIISLGTVDLQLAEHLARRLESLPYYLGASEIDETCEIHRALYLNSLFPICQVTNGSVGVFWDKHSGYDCDDALLHMLSDIGFVDVGYEILSPF